MPDQQIRFTPEELQKLIDANELEIGDIRLMHPDDQKVAMSLHLKQTMSTTPLMASGAPGMGTSVSAAGLGGKALEVGKQAIPYAGPIVGGAIGSAVGHPILGSMLGSALTGGRGFFRGPRAASPKAAPAGSTAPAEFTATAGTRTPAPRMNGFSTPGQTTSTTTPNAARPPKLGVAEPQGTASNVQKAPPTGPSGLNPTEAAERVGKGVQNDFRGRVTFQKDPTRKEYPTGANSKTKPADFKRLQAEDAERAGSSAEVDAIREFLRGKDFGKTPGKTPTRLRKK